MSLPYKKLAPFVVINFIDAVSYMVVSPSIVFYVKQVGGTNTDYGLCLSIFSFAAFLGKPFLGMWSDATWGSYRAPYVFSMICGILGGLLYFFASAFYTPKYAVGFIFVGRLLCGIGGANSVLAFAYMAKVMPQDQQTRINIALSITRILGMSMGPLFNVFLSQIHGMYSFLGRDEIPLDNLNSVGLVLVLANVITLLDVLIFLEEPPSSTSAVTPDKPGGSLTFKAKLSCVLYSIFSFKVFVPVLCIFSFNAAFQLIETAFPPAANDSLGWGPIQTSAVLGGTSIVITFAMMFVFYLSSKGVKDEALLSFGLAADALGTFMIYIFWVANGRTWEFVFPIILTCLAFPFMAAPTRSIFTAIVANDPALEDKQGFMQALLGMSASLAGFLIPSFVAVMVLPDPSTIHSSPNNRELTPFALFGPILLLCSLSGVLYLWYNKDTIMKSSTQCPMADAENQTQATETTGLVPEKPATTTAAKRRSSVAQQIIDPKVQAHRRSSVQMMGGIVAWDLKEDDDE